MSYRSSESPRDLLNSETHPSGAGLPQEPHTGQEPGATEGRVNPERSEPQGRVDADRAAGMSGHGSETGGSVTPPQLTTPRENTGEIRERKLAPISPVQVDGGANLVNRTLPPMPPLAARIFEHCLAAPRGSMVLLPLREAAPGGGRDTWAEMTGSTVSRGRRSVEFIVHGHVYCKWRPDAPTGSEFEMEFKAPGLWTHGWERQARFWICEMHNLLFGGDCDYEMVADNGWRVTRVPLCVDFLNLDIRLEDASRWVNVKRTDVQNGYWTRICGNVKDQTIETLYVGKAGGNCQICIYDKRAEILSKATHSHAGTYLPTWEAHGYQKGDAVRRVECRLRQDGLSCRDGDERFSLRDPVALGDQELINKFWTYHTFTRRLHMGDNTRATRCTTDPRWDVVMAGGAETDDVRRWSRAREVADNAIERRQMLAIEAAIRNLFNVLALETGSDHDEPRWSIFKALADGIAGKYHLGEDQRRRLEWLVENHFNVARRRYWAELGEAIQLRSDMIDDELGDAGFPGTTRDERSGPDNAEHTPIECPW